MIKMCEGKLSKRFICALLVILTLLGGGACNRNSEQIEVPDVAVTLKIKRFDQDLHALEPDNFEKHLPEIQAKYPDFFPFYLEQILGFGNYMQNPEVVINRFREYLKDSYVQEVFDTCDEHFNDLSVISEELESAFKFFKYYFPEKNIPTVITFVSNFGWSNVTFDTTILGIGLDMYLGRDFKYYSTLFPQYVYETFTKEYIVPNCMKNLLSLYFQLQPKNNQLLSHMISQGISLYFLDLTLPKTEDYLKIGYMPEDIKWCVVNEPEIWNFFVEREMLYSTEIVKNKKYVTPGPSSSGMPPESPGNIGSWVGWQIVRAYMEKRPETTFEELIQLDPKTILFQANYKPNRELL